MKIGILTFHLSENYGAMLQAAALYYFLSQNGQDTQVINYPIKYKKLPFKKNVIHIIWEFIRDILGNKQRKKGAEYFRKNFMGGITDEYEVDLYNSTAMLNFDKLIVGSDQVWNQKITNDSAYFLTFAKKHQQKYSYAASFGSLQFDKERCEELYNLLTSFTAVSVRETSSNIMLKNIGIRSNVVCDPCFLLDKNDWTELLGINNNKNMNKYVFCYVLPGNETSLSVCEIAKNIAHDRNLELVIVGDREYKALFSNFYKNSVSPTDFVSYIANAELVVTNSFHGTCFSVIFERDFFTIVSSKNDRAYRIIDMLRMFNMENRLLDMDDRAANSFSNHIIYEEVKPNINMFINNSKKFIENKILK